MTMKSRIGWGACFLCRFVIVFTILALPWPGANEAYSRFFRGLSMLVLGGESSDRELSFEHPAKGTGRASDLRVVIVNSALMNADGSGPVRNLDVGIDQRGLALLVALILATPVSRTRRGWTIFWGAISIHGAMLLILNFLIWRESAEIGLVTLPPFWKAAADTIRGIAIEQIDLGLPILIWILVTFRRDDRIVAVGQGGEDGDRAVGVPAA